MKSPQKKSHPVVKLVQAVLDAQRALSDIPLWRLMKTLKATLGAMPAAEGRRSWQKFAVHVFEQQQLQETLEQLIAACHVHRGGGLRKARIIKSAAIKLRRECGEKNSGEIDDQGTKELKRLLNDYEQVQAK